MSQVSISHSKVTAALIAAIALFVLVAVLLWVWTDVDPVRNPALSIEGLPSSHVQSVSNTEEVLARPLFWHGRQPSKMTEDANAEDEGAVAISPLKEIKLLGIILTGDIRTALLSVEGKVISAHAGQVIQNWTIDDVTAKEVVFVAGTDQTILSLVRKRPASIQLEAIEEI